MLLRKIMQNVENLDGIKSSSGEVLTSKKGKLNTAITELGTANKNLADATSNAESLKTKLNNATELADELNGKKIAAETKLTNAKGQVKTAQEASENAAKLSPG